MIDLLRSKYITISKFVELTGYTTHAVQGKIKTGVWVEGIHYRHSPDNRVLINMEAYTKWVEGYQSIDLLAELRVS